MLPELGPAAFPATPRSDVLMARAKASPRLTRDGSTEDLELSSCKENGIRTVSVRNVPAVCFLSSEPRSCRTVLET